MPLKVMISQFFVEYEENSITFIFFSILTTYNILQLDQIYVNVKNFTNVNDMSQMLIAAANKDLEKKDRKNND